MKSFIAFIFAAFFAGSALAQDQIQNQPLDSPQQGWYKQACPITGGLGKIVFKNRDTGWASSGNFTIYTTNGGATWLPYQTGIGVLGFIDSFGYARTSKGNNWIATTTNNGKTWQDDSVFDQGSIDMVQFCSPSLGFAPRGTNIARTSDGGKSWTHITSAIASIKKFVCFDSLNIFAGGDDHDNNPPYSPIAGLALSNNGGKDWQKLVPKLSSGLNDVVALDSMTLVETGGDIFRSTNRGNSWKEMTIRPSIPNNLVLRAVAVTEGHNLIAVGSRGVILRSIDSGSTWIEQNSTTTLELDDVTFIDTITGWAVGELGTILHTTNGGLSWVKQYPIYDSLNVQIYPNPANIQVSIGYTLPLSQHLTLSILDITGKKVLSPVSDLLEPPGVNFININVANLPAGPYLYQLTTDKYSSTGKFTVIH